MAADKGKKSKIDEEESDQIDGELVLCVEKLQEVQDELEKVNEEASDKVLEIEQKYNEIRRPVYVKRAEIIKDIPQFWTTAITSHPVISDILSEEDHKIFKYLNSIDVEDFKDLKSGYSVTFYFNPNPYFEDTKLTKTFSFSDDGNTKIEGTAIKWKEGSGIANGDSQGKKGNKRPFLDSSFFAWFSETNCNDIMDGVTDEIGDMIKDDLWPNPLRYFNNEADEDFEDDDDDEGKGINGEDEDDEDDDDDEDEDGEDGEDN